MDDLSRKKLFLITFFLDLFLLYIIFFNQLNYFDFFWILSVIVCHMLFYYNLVKENRYVLDVLHYFVFIFPSLALFTKNVLIKFVCIFLLILIQILWIIEKRCILNEENTEFGYGNELNYYLIILTPLLAYSID